MRAPVITVSCPSCGGKVDDAEPGRRTPCPFCGTELHIPMSAPLQPESTRPSATDHAAAASFMPPRSHKGVYVVVAVALVIAAACIQLTKMSRQTASYPATSRSAASPLKQTSGWGCFADCTGNCTTRENADADDVCFKNCEARCGVASER